MTGLIWLKALFILSCGEIPNEGRFSRSFFSSSFFPYVLHPLQLGPLFSWRQRILYRWTCSFCLIEPILLATFPSFPFSPAPIVLAAATFYMKFWTCRSRCVYLLTTLASFCCAKGAPPRATPRSPQLSLIFLVKHAAHSSIFFLCSEIFYLPRVANRSVALVGVFQL